MWWCSYTTFIITVTVTVGAAAYFSGGGRCGGASYTTFIITVTVTVGAAAGGLVAAAALRLQGGIRALLKAPITVCNGRWAGGVRGSSAARRWCRVSLRAKCSISCR